MRSMILALVAILLVAAGPAFAGGQSGQVEIGGFVGKTWLDEYGIFEPKDHVMYGARLGLWVSDHVSLEASGQILKTETEFEILGVPDEDFHLKTARLNLLYNLGGPGSSVRPFLTAGFGHDKVEIDNFGESCDWGWNAGGGLRFFLSRHVNLRLDGRYARTKVGDEVDDSQGNAEAAIGLGFLFGGHHHEEAAVVEPPPPPAPNQPPTVSCSPERAQILPGETVAIRATASDPENGPLTYAWTATGGQVSGTADAATLVFTGVNPPSSATITVKVTDDHGQTASSDCSVSLVEPVKPAEAVSCTAGNFPRNLARLSNVDKACLDDVAQKLTSDPRAHVVVIGYSDSHETVKSVDAKRADAVKTYLVKERSIDLARVTVRNAGTTKPVGTDAAGNRRVEIWFVPDGAKDPD